MNYYFRQEWDLNLPFEIFLLFLPSRKKERCLSGRKGRFAKPLYELKLVPRVRIPPSPLKNCRFQHGSHPVNVVSELAQFSKEKGTGSSAGR
jgi:hypothetical protein